ncbi:hypothetical protein COO60DRAFT_1182478 [Scenedesmus sp. NREL 46B-D3]|nr:hypothetical protein COO60DRAFT_1182478 [Scenedesmus sp. NREL 46B-D3]
MISCLTAVIASCLTVSTTGQRCCCINHSRPCNLGHPPRVCESYELYIATQLSLLPTKMLLEQKCNLSKRNSRHLTLTAAPNRKHCWARPAAWLVRVQQPSWLCHQCNSTAAHHVPNGPAQHLANVDLEHQVSQERQPDNNCSATCW